MLFDEQFWHVLSLELRLLLLLLHVFVPLGILIPQQQQQQRMYRPEFELRGSSTDSDLLQTLIQFQVLFSPFK